MPVITARFSISFATPVDQVLYSIVQPPDLMSLGIYISVPFCRSKCTYCNFASGVFSAAQMGGYMDRLSADVVACRGLAASQGAEIPATCDSIYLGGGTPSLLQPLQLEKLFFILRHEFAVAGNAEITVECAPGTLSDEVVAALVRCGVNRVSLGVQSFDDREARSVARLHTRGTTLQDIDRLRAAGIQNINIDLIAGLPHQTASSWTDSVEQAIASGVPHVSVYMLEVDEDSRLGRELIAGGTKYHAHFVPDEDATADFYLAACAQLERAGIRQYEISNFARPGLESLHNLKYWTRRPYLGFGVDAHSMLASSPQLREQGVYALRFATTDSYDGFLKSPEWRVDRVSGTHALEEAFFLGLRLNRGLLLGNLRREFGAAVDQYEPVLRELIAAGLLSRNENEDVVQLTTHGRLLSNEVFEKFILDPVTTEK
jgi:oxygen-independent coproporphyrinogen-3 oxidase